MVCAQLSINDCRADIRVSASGIDLRYGRDEVRVPHGGGTLIDVRLERPDFAERLEIEPLGLSFGQKNSARAQSHCSTGWWGARVVLRRLPPGRYTLRWTGRSMRRMATMELTESNADGAELIRVVQIP